MTATTYTETDCAFTHDGRTYEAAGAHVDDQFIIAYPGKGGILASWHGERMGTWRATSSWRVRSYIGTRMYQIVAILDDGRIYTGRGFGEGCIFRGERIASQRRKA